MGDLTLLLITELGVLEPARKQLQELLEQCADYEEFQARLAELAQTLDVDDLQNLLSLYMFAARHLTRNGLEDGNA